MAIIEKKSLVDLVYEKLRGDILSLQIPLGSKINVNELQGKLEVSCTPIREAVNRLQQEGLVVYENNVGARVLALEEHDVEEIQQLAMTLHCAAIRLAMERGDRDVIIGTLSKHIEEFKKAKTVQSRVMAVNHLVGVFYHNCGNRRLDKSMIAIQGQQLLLRYIYASQGGDKETDMQDFDAMRQGVVKRDPDEVCAALQRNADRSLPFILKYIGV